HVAAVVAIGRYQHGIDLVAYSSGQPQHLRHAILYQPGLVGTAQARGAASGEQSKRGCRGSHLPRLECRIRRFFFFTWRSLSTFLRSLYGLSPSLKTKRTGVPTSLKRLRKKFSR